jgi:hypothetical protein
MVPGDREGATKGKTILTFVYIGKNSSFSGPAGQFQSNLVQIIFG